MIRYRKIQGFRGDVNLGFRKNSAYGIIKETLIQVFYIVTVDNSQLFKSINLKELHNFTF